MLDKLDRTAVDSETKMVMRHFDDVVALIGEGASGEAFVGWIRGLNEKANASLMKILDLLPEESAKNGEEEFGVWTDAVGQRWTNLPPYCDYDGHEEGEFGDAGYRRILCGQEAAAAEAWGERDRATARDPGKLARGIALRDAWFGSEDGTPPPALGNGDGLETDQAESAEEAEAALGPIEYKSMDGPPRSPLIRSRPRRRQPFARHPVWPAAAIHPHYIGLARPE